MLKERMKKVRLLSDRERAGLKKYTLRELDYSCYLRLMDPSDPYVGKRREPFLREEAEEPRRARR